MKRSLLAICILGLVIAIILGGCSTPAPSSTSQPAPTKTSITSPAQTAAPTTTAAQSAAPTTPAAAVTSTSPAAQPTYTLRLHYETVPGAPLTAYGWEPWAKAVETATNGRVKMQLFNSDTLFKTKTDAVDAIKADRADIGMMYAWAFPGSFDLTDAVCLPFLAPNAEVGSRVTWALYQQFPEIQAQWKDVKLLSAWTTDPYFLITTKKQIKTLEDFQGMKMRVTGGMGVDMMKLLGGTPLTPPMPDCYVNLQKGVMDGMTTNGEATTGFRLYELVKYYTYVPTTSVTQEMIMNKDKWNSLPKDIQDQIMSVSGENAAIRFGGSVFDRASVMLPDVIQKGGFERIAYTPPQTEIDRWVAVAGTPLYAKWVQDMQKQGFANAQAIQNAAISLVKQYSSGKTNTWQDLFK